MKTPVLWLRPLAPPLVRDVGSRAIMWRLFSHSCRMCNLPRQFGKHSYTLTDFSAFSCRQGHVFLVMSDEADVRKYDLTKSELIIT